MLVKEKQEEGHWYTLTGEPAYTIKGTNGAERNTTLKDARKLGLCPSVTTVMKLMDRPALTNWMVDQAIWAALTLPKDAELTDQEHHKKIKEDSRVQGQQAASVGTDIHAAIENAIEGRLVVSYQKHADNTIKALDGLYGNVGWICEKAFADARGFGGRVDLHVAPCKEYPNGIVADVKSKDFDDVTKASNMVYDENIWQLAAYRQGLGIPDAIGANILVSRKEGLVYIKQWTFEEMDWGWDCFTALLEFWQIKNNYRPGLIP